MDLPKLAIAVKALLFSSLQQRTSADAKASLKVAWFPKMARWLHLAGCRAIGAKYGSLIGQAV